MKQKIKVIVYNIILICILAFILNTALYVILASKDIYNHDISFKHICENYRMFITRDISLQDTYNRLITSNDYRNIENKNSKKRAIVLFGCSFTYGTGLTPEQTISHKLGVKTGCPIL